MNNLEFSQETVHGIKFVLEELARIAKLPKPNLDNLWTASLSQPTPTVAAPPPGATQAPAEVKAPAPPFWGSPKFDGEMAVEVVETMARIVAERGEALKRLTRELEESRATVSRQAKMLARDVEDVSRLVADRDIKRGALQGMLVRAEVKLDGCVAALQAIENNASCSCGLIAADALKKFGGQP
jgi:hypothetical protein